MFYVLPAAAFEIGDLELQAKQNFCFQILNLQVERLTKMHFRKWLSTNRQFQWCWRNIIRQEYGANFGHEHYFLAYICSFYFVGVSQCLLLVLIFHVLLLEANVSPGVLCVTCNTQKIYLVDGLMEIHTHRHQA